MDKELPDAVRKEIERLVTECDFCHGIHDLRTRDLGGMYMFELHLELDGNLSLAKAHDLTDEVEDKLKKQFPNAQVIIHQDPAGLKENRLDSKLVKKL